MGATYDEVLADYMVTFYNYYGVQSGTDQYKQISNNIIKNLSTAFGIQMSELATADLAAEAEDYLKELGVSDATIAAVKAKLSPAPAEPEYVYYHGMGVADGDEVVIYHPDSGKAISNADSTVASNPERYRLGVDTTVENGMITEPDESTIWTVEVDANGIAFKDADGKYLSVPSTYGNLVLDSDCKYWTITEATTEGAVYLISTESKGTSGDLRGIEYYQEKFTTYYASETNLANNQAAFALELYIKTDKSTIHEHDWVAGTVDPADCTHQEVTHYTCSVCHEEKTEVTAEALGHQWGDWAETTPATCTAKGEETRECGRCHETETQEIAMLAHVDEDEDGKCDNCGADMSAASNVFSLFTGDLAEGDYLIVYKGKALKASQTANANRFDYAEVTEGESITCDDALLIFHIAQSGDYWTIYNAEAELYIGGTGTKNQGKLIGAGTDYSLWTVTASDGKYDFTNKGNDAAGVNKTLRNNGTYGWACYSTQTGGELTLYKLG